MSEDKVYIYQDVLKKAVVDEMQRLSVMYIGDENFVKKFLEYMVFLTAGRPLSEFRSEQGLVVLMNELSTTLWLVESLENIAQSFYMQLYLIGGEEKTVEEIKQKVIQAVLSLGTQSEMLAEGSAIFEKFAQIYQKQHHREVLEGIYHALPWLAVIYLLAVFQTAQNIEQTANLRS